MDDGSDITENTKNRGKMALEFCKKLMAEPLPDYPDEDELTEEELKKQERALVREQIKNNAETGTKDRAGQINDIRMSLRNSIMGRSRMRDSYSNNLERSRQFTLDNEDFLKRSRRFVEESQRPVEEQDGGVRYRKNKYKEKLTPYIGKSLPENESAGVRRFGSTAPAQKDFLEKMREKASLTERYKLGASRRDTGVAGIGRSFRRTDDVDTEEDIYDEIPATGTLGRAWQKRMRNFDQQSSSTVRNGRANSGYNQWLN